MIEYAVLEKLLPAMAEIMNAVPGEGFRMQKERYVTYFAATYGGMSVKRRTCYL
ncbi:MAG: hypothetical protein ACLT1J_01000 [Mediterraneibacter gnavus]